MWRGSVLAGAIDVLQLLSLGVVLDSWVRRVCGMSGGDILVRVWVLQLVRMGLVLSRRYGMLVVSSGVLHSGGRIVRVQSGTCGKLRAELGMVLFLGLLVVSVSGRRHVCRSCGVLRGG